MSELQLGGSWAGGWDEPGVLSLLIVNAGTPGSGIFEYAPSPGLGNLIGSDTAAAGTDIYGNAYLAGKTTYFQLGVSSWLATQVYRQTVTWYAAAVPEGPYTALQSIGYTAANGGGLFFQADQFSYANQFQGGAQPLYLIMPSGDTSGVLDKANITGALSMGAAVQLFPGQYYISTPIEIPQGGVLRGAGKGGLGIFLQTTIRATAAMSAMIASAGWLASANTAAQETITIEGLKLYGGNQATYGIVSQNYDSLFADLEIQATTSDSLRFDAFGADGTTQLTTTGVNNKIRDCTFQNMGGRGLATNDRPAGVTGVFTDGFIENCIFAGSGTQAAAEMLRVSRCIGWHISGNHLYGLTQNGMHLDFLQNTRIIGNYIEQWGTTATAGTYSGIYASSADDGEGSVISGNMLDYNHSPGNAATNIHGIQLDCLPGSTAHAAITGNMMYCFPPPANFGTAYGEYLNNQANTCTIVVATTGNLIFGTWTAQVQQVPNGGTVTVSAGA